MSLPIKNLKFNFDSLVAVLFIISCVIPYISYIGRGNVISYFIFIVWFISVIFKKKQFHNILHTLGFRKPELLLLFVFLLIALFNYFFITSTGKAFQFALMPVTYFLMIVMDAYYFKRDPRYKLSIFFVVLIVLGIQAAISIPYTFNSDDLVSRMYTAGELEGAALEEALKNGVGSANLYAFLCGVFFLSIGMLKKFDNKRLKFLIVVGSTIILISIVSSSYSVSFTMLIAGGLIFLLRLNWLRIKIKHILATFLIITGLIVFYNSVLSNSKLIEPIERKINLIKNGNLREDGRMDLADRSLHTFLDNPFFGVGVPEWGLEKQIGEHMPWIDFPAHYGFIGFLPFVLFLIILFKRNYKFYFRSSKNNIYATSCLIGFLIFIISNFIDPLIFESSMIVMLLFFYTSIVNWEYRPVQRNNI